MSTQKPISPPSWADRFLEWFCSDRLLEEVQGDLHEAYGFRVNTVGRFHADIWFVLDVLLFFKPAFIQKLNSNQKTVFMHSNYFKITYRNFLKYKVYSSINLSGLVVGITSCLLISLHVLEEFSYDTFHPDAQNKYRLVMDMYNNGDELSAHSAPVYAAVGPNIREDYPEITDYLRILPFGSGVYAVRKPDGTLVRYNEERAVFSDPNFFTMFGFELLKGNPEEVLKGKNQTVLTESAAGRYFGSEDPIGKTILYRGTREFVVTGVMKNFPENSHMQFDIVSSLNSWDGYEEWPQNWGWYDFYTFIQVNASADLDALKLKAADYLMEKNPEEYEQSGSKDILILQHLPEIHLYSEGLSWEMGDNGGANQVYFLALIAGLILLIAWVNYINLSTARAVKRAREVGIRKVVGARKRSLISQFLTESFVYNFFAVVLSIALVVLLAPFVNTLLDITLDLRVFLTTYFVLSVLGLILVSTLISGLYPAFVLTGFKPIQVLKGNFYNRRARFGFRQVLVIVQFTISIVLILGTLLAVRQLQYMQSQDLGFNAESTMVIKGPSSGVDGDDLASRKEIFYAQLKQFPSVKGFSVSNVVPGVENFSISSFTTRYSDKARDIYRVRVDENFFPDYEIEILEGRNFIRGMARDTASALINETAFKLLGYESMEQAIGEKLNPNGSYPWTIIGIVKDYHHSSLKESMDPIFFSFRTRSGNFFSLKVDQQNISQTITDLETTWNEIYPDNPFEYFFLDEFFGRQYKSDNQFTAVFNSFAGLAIFVAILGLFGLVSFTAEQARKEIGIRKVLGATAMKIITLFARDYTLLIGISMMIAFPLGYFLMERWLEDFAYRTNINTSIFLVGGFTILVVAFLTVSFKSLSAASSNPVDALREE